MAREGVFAFWRDGEAGVRTAAGAACEGWEAEDKARVEGRNSSLSVILDRAHQWIAEAALLCCKGKPQQT